MRSWRPDAAEPDGQENPTDKNERTEQVVGRVNYRFRRTHRLLDAADFRRVFEDAARSRDGVFTVLARKNGTGDARLGLAISKKHCRLASGRNRLRRIVRESFRAHRTELAGLDLVVMAQQGAAAAGNEQLRASLARHWRRLRLASPQDSGG